MGTKLDRHELFLSRAVNYFESSPEEGALYNEAGVQKFSKTETSEVRRLLAQNRLSEREFTQAGIPIDNKFLVDAVASEDQNSDRNFLALSWISSSPYAAARRLSQAHIGIFGCGGVGSAVATHLAKLGIGKITISDHDVVETVNLDKSLVFDQNDIGKLKTAALAGKLQSSATTVRALPYAIVPELIRNVKNTFFDFLVLAFDYRVPHMLNAIEAGAGHWYAYAFDCGVRGWTGVVGPVTTKSEDLRESRIQRGGIRKPIGNPGTAITTNLVGAIVASEIVQSIALRTRPRLLGAQFTLDLRDLRAGIKTINK